ERGLRLRVDGADPSLGRRLGAFRRSAGATARAAARTGTPGHLPVHARRAVAHGHVRVQASAPGRRRQDAALRDPPTSEGTEAQPRPAAGLAVPVFALRGWRRLDLRVVSPPGEAGE